MRFESIFFFFDFASTETGKGKLSEQAYLKYGKTRTSNGERTRKYHVKFHVEPNFGTPGALVIRNTKNIRFFLKSAALQIQNSQILQFDCYSWVYPFEKTRNRIFFSNIVS